MSTIKTKTDYHRSSRAAKKARTKAAIAKRLDAESQLLDTFRAIGNRLADHLRGAQVVFDGELP